MRALQATVKELLAAAQVERNLKVKLYAGRQHWFKVGDRFCCGPRSCSTPHRSRLRKLCLRWDAPFTVTACPSPNAYTLASDALQPYVDHLKPF